MGEKIFIWTLTLILLPAISCMDLDSLNSLEPSNDLSEFVGEERFLIVGGLNLSQVAGATALAAAALLPLLGLAALCLLLWAIMNQGGYGAHAGAYGSHSTYSSSYRSFGKDADWEKLSIIEWILLARETYLNYNPSNFECQKRVVCELFQNAEEFGPPVQIFIKYFSYLKSFLVLNIPDAVKIMAESLLDAAAKGKMLKKDCVDIYKDCKFSLKKVVNKYRHMKTQNKDRKGQYNVL